MQRITHTAARLVCFVMLAGLLAAAGTAQADTHTWDSGGGDNNFNTGANWDQSDTAPVDSDGLAFGTGARTSPTNDLAAGTDFAGITFNSGSPAFTIGGNSFDLTGDIVNNDDSLQTLNTAIVLAGATRTVNAASGNITLGGAIGGSQGLTKSGSGTLTINGTNTYDGATAINGGTLTLGGVPPVSGAVLWVDASTLSAGSYNAATTPVNNLGTRGGSFSAGPYSVSATGINGRAALQFNGTSDYLKSTTAYTNSGPRLTMFVVEKRITDNGAWKGSVSCTDGTVKDNESALAFALNQDDSSPCKLLIARALNGKAPITHPGNSTSFVSTVVFDNTNCTHYLKTSSGSSTNSAGSADGNFGITSTVLGSRQRPLPTSENSYANINIGEVLIYNSALSTADREAVESYLAAKWGISGSVSLGALPSSTAVSITNGAVLDLSGQNQPQTIGSLSSADTATRVKLGTGTLTIGAASGQSFAGIVSGVGGLTKTGAGTQTLSGANTYTGATTVSGGRLLLNNATSTCGGSAITVASGAYLGGSGYAGTGLVTVNAGGGLAPGNAAVGTLTAGSSSANANLTANGMTYEWEWDGNAGSNDLVHVKGDLTFNAGTYTVKLVDLGGAAPEPEERYNLFTYSGAAPAQQTWTIDPGTTGWNTLTATVGYDAGAKTVYITGIGRLVQEGPVMRFW